MDDYDDWLDQQLEQDVDPRNLFPNPEQFLRDRFTRKPFLSEEHHDALTKLTPTEPAVFYEMGTDIKAST